jgi:hypothetical protein
MALQAVVPSGTAFDLRVASTSCPVEESPVTPCVRAGVVALAARLHAHNLTTVWLRRNLIPKVTWLDDAVPSSLTFLALMTYSAFIPMTELKTAGSDDEDGQHTSGDPSGASMVSPPIQPRTRTHRCPRPRRLPTLPSFPFPAAKRPSGHRPRFACKHQGIAISSYHSAWTCTPNWPMDDPLDEEPSWCGMAKEKSPSILWLFQAFRTSEWPTPVVQWKSPQSHIVSGRESLPWQRDFMRRLHVFDSRGTCSDSGLAG